MLTRLNALAAIVALAACAGAATSAQSVKGTIALKGIPEGVGVNYLTNRIYVPISAFDDVSDSLAIIDGKSDTVIQTLTIPPVGKTVAVDVVRNLIYVGGSYLDVNGVQQSKVAVISGKSNKLIAMIPITTTPGTGIEALAVNPISGEIYVANASDDVVDVIAAGGEKVRTQISVPESPYGIAVNPYNNQVYVAISNGTVAVIDGRNDKLAGSATVGGANAGIGVNLASGKAFVTNNTSGPSTVGILSKTGAVLANVAVGRTPFDVDVDLVTNLAFVTNVEDSTISVIDGNSNRVRKLLPVAGLYIAVNPGTQKVYVAGQDNSITVIKEN